MTDDRISNGQQPLEPTPEARRSRLLATYRGLVGTLARVRFQIDSAGADEREQLLRDEADLEGAITDARETYRELVPVLPLSRSPVTGEVFERSIDFYGLDGLWWNAEAPVRPVEPVYQDFIAFKGAMRLGSDVEETAHLVKPGPGVPFVVPELLRRPGVVAVVSQLPVGEHTGYAVVYFAADYPPDAPRSNNWGMNRFEWITEDGSLAWGEEPEIEEDYDFNLRPWLERGDLLWIAPADRDLTLREGAAECPYTEVDGLREIQRVKDGAVWHRSLVE